MFLFAEVLTVDQALSKLRRVVRQAETRSTPAEMPWAEELRALAAKARADVERKARERAAYEAAQERRRLEIEELRKQGKWKTKEDVEREQREAAEAYRRSQ